MSDDAPGELRRALEALLWAIATADLAVLEPLWCEDASLYFTVGSPAGLVNGRPAVLERFRRMFAELTARLPGPPYVSFRIEEFACRVLDYRHALVFATLTFQGQLGQRTLVYRREDGALRILHLHASNLAARGPPAA